MRSLIIIIGTLIIVALSSLTGQAGIDWQKRALEAEAEAADKKVSITQLQINNGIMMVNQKQAELPGFRGRAAAAKKALADYEKSIAQPPAVEEGAVKQPAK